MSTLPRTLPSTHYAVTAGRVGSCYFRVRGFSVYVMGIKVYKLQKRQKDGVYTYRLHDTFATRTGRFVSGRLMKEAKAYAELHGLPFDRCLRAGMVAKLNELEQLALECSDQ